MVIFINCSVALIANFIKSKVIVNSQSQLTDQKLLFAYRYGYIVQQFGNIFKAVFEAELIVTDFQKLLFYNTCIKRIQLGFKVTSLISLLSFLKKSRGCSLSTALS